MNALLPASLAIVAYAATTFLQWRALNSRPLGSRVLLWFLVACALLFHGIVAFAQLHPSSGWHLGIFSVASTVNWLAVLLVTLFAIRLPIANLLLLTCPLSLLAMLASLVFDSGRQAALDLEPEHIIPSLLAYSVLFIAACQAVLLAIQEHRLRTSKSLLGLRLLPPLQAMENLLFELLWVGLVLLTIAIVTGLLFLDNMFEQRVVHHAVLSMSSWLVFAILLWGRYTLGWRGTTAIRWTLAGFSTLALAYFGSKAVIELLLQR